AMIRDGLFRKDLYYRLNVINIVLPPLRQRRDEIPVLAAKILSQISEESKTGLKRIDASGLQALMGYDWPGNIRELENLLKRLTFLVDDGVITSQAIMMELHTAATLNGGVGGAASEIRENERELIIRVLENCNYNKSAAAEKLGITRQTLYNKIKKYQIS
ncbi:MAG TPA: Fis family transcriptional regulator, partial [Acetobacterium sp.]|nr:Fis family transcriptional regulator [Acetobacterium sp.]